MIETTTNKLIYLVGGDSVYAFPIPFFEKSDIHCYMSNEKGIFELKNGSQFSVEDKDDYSNGALITLLDNHFSGSKLTISRVMIITQDISLPQYGKIPSPSLERQLDKTIMICQQLREMLSRVVMVPPGLDATWEALMELLTSAGADAQTAAQQAQEILDTLLGMGLDSLALLDSPSFIGTPTAPTAGQGTNTGQLATTAFVQNELTDMLISTKVSFGSAQWLLDSSSGKYYLDVVTQATMFNHVYKDETGGAMLFDDSIEVHVKDEGYLHLVSTSQFAGYLYTLSPRKLPSFSYSPVTVDGEITSLKLSGLVTNPMNVTEFSLPSSAVLNGETYSVTEIADNAFSGNTKLTKVTIGEGIKKIGQGAFWGCSSLSELNLPASLREISSNFIYGATSLTSLTLNEGLESIWSSSFHAANLSSLHIPASVLNISEGAIRNGGGTEITVDAGNTHYKAANGCLYSKDGSLFLAYPCKNSRTEFTPEAGVKRIGNYAFHGAALTTLTIPDGCEELGASVFYNAYITNLSLPGSISEISAGALNISGLASISLRSASERYSVIGGVLYDDTDGVLVKCTTGASALGGGTGTFTIPDGITKIDVGALRDCSIGTLDTNDVEAISDDVLTGTSIGKWKIKAAVSAIGNCDGLNAEEIEVEAGNTHFMAENNVLFTADGGELVYYSSAKELAAYTVPSTVTKIRKGAIRNSSLVTLTLPDSCTEVGTYGIKGMSAMTTLNLGGGLQTLQVNALSTLPLITSLTFPATLQTLTVSSVVTLLNLTDVTFLGTGTWSMTGAFANCPKLLRIHGYAGSTAEAFAAANNYLFIPLT